VQHDDRAGVSAARTEATVAAKKRWRGVPVTIRFRAGLAFQAIAKASISSVCRTKFHEGAPGLRGHVEAQDVREAGIREEQAFGAFTTARLPPCFRESREERLRSSVSVEWCVELCGGLIERDGQRIESIAGAIGFDGAKIALRNPAWKTSQEFHAKPRKDCEISNGNDAR